MRLTVSVLVALVGCSGEDALDPEGPGWQIGAAGTPPVVAEQVFQRRQREVADLAFDPMFENRLWVMMRERTSTVDLICDPTAQAGCDAMPSRTATIDDPGPDQTVEVIEDSNAWHFMRRTVTMAMGDNTGFWASCGDFWTGNFTDTPIMFIGPSLWSSDLSLHGNTPPGGNGSHYDMLHGTPWCTGIAWEVDNVYWALNGELGALDRVNFNDDHGPGADDHSDGEYERYAEGEMLREEGVPSHMEVDGNWLYVADTGNQRVVRLDITSGRNGGSTTTADPVPVQEMRGETLEDFVPATFGLDKPSGLTVHDGILFVSDFDQAIIYAFDQQGVEVGRIDVSDVAESATGLEISPEGWLYFSDMDGGAVYRLVPAPPEEDA